MAKYDFNVLSQRRHTNSSKWDVLDNELPMWVADMDFLVLPEIQEALKKAIDVGTFGYTFPTDHFFNAYQRWWKDRHSLLINKEAMIFAAGIVAALDSLVNNLTNKGDAILLLSPSYNGFFSAVSNNHRQLVTSDLIYQNDEFIIDYEDVENKIKNNNVKLTIFCNPHNPTGKIWNEEEIKRFYDICHQYNVIFISDEIHCDIVDPTYQYVPALKVSDDIITCLAPSKVFNLAGVQSAVIVVNNKELKEKVQAYFYHDDIGEPNYFVEPATIAAYTKGDEYVDELNIYLANNKKYVKDFLSTHLPHLKVVSGHATYLLWIDISYYQIDSHIFAKELRKETGLFINDGEHYGKNGKYYIRMNVATSLQNVKDGLTRLELFIKSKEK